jgi:hypothetical protein
MFFNQAFERLWGLDHERLAGEPGLGEVLDLLREMRMLPEYADFRRFKTDLIQLFGNLDGVREELLHLPDERTLRLKVSRHPFGGLTFVYEDVTDRLALERSSAATRGCGCGTRLSARCGNCPRRIWRRGRMPRR